MSKYITFGLLLACAPFARATSFDLVDFATQDDNGNTPVVGEHFTTSGNTHTATFDSFLVAAPASAIDVVWKFKFDTTIATPDSPASAPYGLVTQTLKGTLKRTSGQDAMTVKVALSEQILNGSGQSVANNSSNNEFTSNAVSSDEIPFEFSLITAFTPLSQGQAQKDNLVIRFTNNASVRVNSIEQKFTPVPEPASLTALALGGFGLITRRRRK